MWCSGTFASADRRRMVISCLLISSEKIAAGKWCFTDAAARGDGVQLVHGRLEDVLEAGVVLTHPLLGDVVDLLLRAVDDVVDVALAAGGAVAELDDARARLHEAPQHGLLGDDRGVV